MKLTTIAVAAFSLALLAACDRGEPRPKLGANPAASGSSAAPESKLPTSSANDGKSERTPPVQGQVDSKEPAQNKDFEHPQTKGK